MMNGFCIKKNVELQDNDTFSLNTNLEASLILGATTVGRAGSRNKGTLRRAGDGRFIRSSRPDDQVNVKEPREGRRDCYALSRCVVYK